MTARTVMFWVCGGLLSAACGGTPAGSTSSTDSTHGSLSGVSRDGGAKSKGDDNDQGNQGKSCKPLDGGRSPCARGDGGGDDMDEMGDDDGGDQDLGDDDGGHHGDGGDRGDDDDDGHQGDGGHRGDGGRHD